MPRWGIDPPKLANPRQVKTRNTSNGEPGWPVASSASVAALIVSPYLPLPRPSMVASLRGSGMLIPGRPQGSPKPRPDFFGEQFQRPDHILLRKIPKEARHQHEVAETEFLMQRGDPLDDGVRTADNRYLA